MFKVCQNSFFDYHKNSKDDDSELEMEPNFMEKLCFKKLLIAKY